jgi:hypothetical protein
MPRAVFAYQGLRILVESADGSHLGWLGDLLVPDFEPLAGAAADSRVTLVEDAGRYRAALGLGPAGGEIECFAVDARVIRLPRWNSPTGGTTLYEADPGVFYEVRDGARAITLLTDGRPRAARISLMRAVRELVMDDCLARGGVFLQAAALVVGGRGIAVIGPTASGKTTLLIHGLAEGSAQYLAGDRVLVSFESGAPRLRGMPMPITIRPGTRELFPWLDARLGGGAFLHWLSAPEAAGSEEAAPPWPDGRVAVSPARLCAAFSARRVAECVAGALVFPNVTSGPGGFAVRRLSGAEAASRLGRALLGTGSWRKASSPFRPPGNPALPDPAHLAACCGRVGAGVPAFQLDVGLDAFSNEATAGEWLSQLGEARA